MKSVINAFVEKYHEIMDGMFTGDLVGAMSMNDLHQALTRIMKDHVYAHIEIADRVRQLKHFQDRCSGHTFDARSKAGSKRNSHATAGGPRDHRTDSCFDGVVQ